MPFGLRFRGFFVDYHFFERIKAWYSDRSNILSWSVEVKSYALPIHAVHHPALL